MKHFVIFFFLLSLFSAVPGLTVFSQKYIDILPDSIQVQPVSQEDQEAFLRSFPFAHFRPYLFDRESAVADSTLPPSSDFQYGIASALDGSLSTSWAEGEKGPGTSINIVTFHEVKEFGNDYLYVFPGWGGSAGTWRKNNRVESAKIQVIGLNKYTVTGGADWTFLRTTETIEVTFADEYAYQGFPIGRYLFEQYDFFAGGIDLYIVVLEIKSVYPGSSWNDTCISEITVTEGSKQPPPEDPMM